MFFNNHMRTAHNIKVVKSRRSVLKPHTVDYLKYYYYHISDNPTLDEIKELSKELDLKKEKIYWWFFNYRQARKKHQKSKKIEQKECSSATGKIKPRQKVNRMLSQDDCVRKSVDPMKQMTNEVV